LRKFRIHFRMPRMPCRRQLDVQELSRAVGMLQGRQNQRQVAAQFGVSQSVISRVWTPADRSCEQASCRGPTQGHNRCSRPIPDNVCSQEPIFQCDKVATQPDGSIWYHNLDTNGKEPFVLCWFPSPQTSCESSLDWEVSTGKTPVVSRPCGLDSS